MATSLLDLAKGAWGSLTDDPAKVLQNMAQGAADGGFGLPTETPQPSPIQVPNTSPNNGTAPIPLANQQGGLPSWFARNSRLVMIGGVIVAAVGVLVLVFRRKRK